MSFPRLFFKLFVARLCVQRVDWQLVKTTSILMRIACLLIIALTLPPKFYCNPYVTVDTFGDVLFFVVRFTVRDFSTRLRHLFRAGKTKFL